MTTQQKTSRRRLHAKRAQQKRQRHNTTIVFGAVLIVLAVYFGAVAPKIAEAKAVSPERLADNPVKGPADAKVVLVEYSDFGCLSCQSWHLSGALEQIMEYFDGQVRIEWRDMPAIMPPLSIRAAEAGQCAHDQGLFWEFHHITYTRADFNALRDDDLFTYAEKAGLDMDAFEECYSTGQHEQTVQYDWDLARELGIRGAPAFVLNGEVVIGASPEVLVARIQELLNE